MYGNRIRDLRKKRNWTQQQLADKVLVDCSSVTKWETGKANPDFEKQLRLAEIFGVSIDYLLGRENNPNIVDDFVTFPVIGEIAAGYDSIVIEDWTGETIDICRSYLKGHKPEDFFVLSVKGDSMYPLYHNGDKVLILKCSTLSYSGQVGAVLYNDEYTTLKKVEYKNGEDWLSLIPINPNYPPERIENEALEHCRILGIPKYLIREIEE